MKTPLHFSKIQSNSFYLVFCLLLLLLIGTPAWSQFSSDDCVGGQKSPFAPNGASQTGVPMQDLIRQRNQTQQELRNLKRYCPDVNQEMAQAQANLRKVQENLAKLRQIRDRLAREGEINFQLPRECNAELSCVPTKGLCAGLDPCKYQDFQTYLERIRCLRSKAFQAASSGYSSFATGSGLIPRWYSGQDHRETMGAYDDIFRSMSAVLNFMDELLGKLSDLDGALQDEIKGQISEALKGIAAEELRGWATPQQMAQLRRLKATMDTAEEVKGGINLVREIMKRGTRGAAPNPSWVFKLNAALYDVAAKATGAAVEGWKEYANFMANQLINAYQHYLCAQQFYQQYLQLLRACPDFCQKAIECHQQKLGRIQEQMRDQRQATESQKDQVNKDLNQFLQAAIPTDLCRAICRAGGVLNVPQAGNPVADRISALLAQRYGTKYCWMKLVFRAECHGTRCTYTYSIEFSEGAPFHKECCKKPQSGITTQPVEGADLGGATTSPPASTPADSRPGTVIGAGTGSRLTKPREPNPPNQGPPNTPGNACDCITPTVKVNGQPVVAGQVIRLSQGSRANLFFRGTCRGNCRAKSTKMWVRYPGASRSMRLSGPRSINLARAGTYKIKVEQICDGKICDLEFVIEVKPKSRDLVKPNNPNNGSKLAAIGCGDDRCIKIRFRSVINPLYKEIFKREESRIKNQSAILKETGSTCFGNLPASAKKISWKITHPDGKIVEKEGREIKHSFHQKGTYVICITLTDKDSGRSTSRTIIVKDP